MLLALMLPFASQAQCGDITTFPWTENFEAMDASTVPTCWDNSASGSSTLTSNPERIWGVYSYSGNKMIRMYNYYVQNGTALINTPTFDLPAGESYDLTFSYSHRASCGAFSVKVSTDNGTTFTELQSYTSTGSNDYTNPGEFTEAEISLAAYAGQSIILQFFSTANYGSGAIFVDDIRIGAPATCFKVTDLAIDASQTTSSSLTLTWTDARNTGATYTIYNGETVVASNVSGTTYPVTGLDANTYYTFGVMTDCGGGDVTDLATVSGRTACGAISLPWTCGFEADEIVNTTQATALPWCSQRYVTPGATSGTNYPYSYAGNFRTGSRSFYYYGSTSASYPDMMAWILPELDVATYPMNANRVTFWAKMGSASYSKYVYVYTVTDPTDITTATLVDSVQVTGTTHTKYSVSLTSAPATDAYLVLAVMKGSGSLYMDDVTLEEMPSCLEVTNLAVSAVTANSITLNWADASNASATYSVYRITTTGDVIDTVLEQANITGTTYTVENLDANTPYVFAVQANCPAGDAPYTLVNGRTSCVAEALPFSEDFSATLASDPCWRGASILYTDGVNVTMGNPTNWTYASSANNGIAAGHYYLNIYGTSRNHWLITPEIDLTTASNPLLTFDAAFTAYSGTAVANVSNIADDKFLILVSTNNGQTWSVASDIALSTLASLTYIPQYVNLATYAGETVRIAFYGESTASGGDNNLHIDNINVDESTGEICYPVSGLAASNVTATGATLTWEGSADSYNVYTIAGLDTTLVDNVSDTALVIDTLTANTSYTFGVTSVCGSDESGMVSVTFRTNCGAEALPFTENFSASLSSDPCWRGASILYADNVEVTMGNIPSNWSYQSSVSNGIEAGHYRVNIYGTGCQYWLITPEIDLTEATNPLLTFDAAFTAYSGTAVASGFESNTSQKFMILVSINNGQTWSVASDIALSTIASLTYIPQYVSLANYAGETVRIAFYAQSTTTGGDNNLHIDNINVDESTGEICYPVSGLAASNVTATGATLTWEGSADSYNVYTIAGLDTTLVDNVSDTALVIDTLTANTSYTFGVTSVCGSDESGMVSVTFRTNCGAEALPFTENFSASLSSDPCWRGASILYADNVEVTMGNIPSNWSYQSSVSNGIEAGHYRVNIYGTGCQYWLITPEIDLTEATNPLLTFDAAFTAYSGTAVASGFESNTSQKFMILVSINNGQTWSVASDIALSTIASLTYIPQYVNLANYAGETVRIAFYAQSTTSGGDNNLHIDNISVDESTGDICYPVTGLTAINVTADSATLTWEGTADSYNVYSIAGTDTTLVDNVTNTFIEIGDLTAMTSYTYGVRSVCGSNESDMVTVNFRTACSSVAIPFTEGFENGIDCWTLTACASSTGVVENTSYSSYANTGTHAFKFAYNTNPPQYLISPELTGTEAGAFVSFMYRVGGTWQESFALGYSTTTNDVTAFTWFTELTGLSNQTYEPYSQILPADVKYVAIKYTANDMLALYIDDFSVTEIPSCPAVTGLTAINVATDSARLIWEGDASSYNVYAISAIDTQLVTTVTDTTVLLNTLTPMTNYTYGVTAVCGSDEGSMVVVEFATACAAIAVPFTENFETTSPTFQCWTVDGVSSTGLSNDAFLFYYSTNPPQYLVSPELSGVTDGLTVSFRYKAYNNYYSESFQLGYSTTTNAYADFTWLAEVNNITSTSYTEYSQILSGAVKYVAVKYTANDQYGLYIDSMVFAEPPACMPVTGLTVDSVTATSVFLSWNGTAAAYNIYSATGNVVATGVTTTNYEVTGLTASTNYTFGVASVCGSDQSDVVTVPARTDCAGGSCTIKIYAEDEYGDGWADDYGAAYSNITISQNGATVATYSMQSQDLEDVTIYDTFTVNVCSGMPVTFTWNSNSEYDSEASFKILDGNDTVLISVSDASTLTDGAAFLTVNDACGSNTPIQILDSMKVTVAVNNATMGTTVPAPGVHYFYEGEVASVVAQPAAGYHLVGWTILATGDYSNYGYGIMTLVDTTLNIAEPNVFNLFSDFDTVRAGYHRYEWSVTANFAAGEPELDTLTLIVNVPDPTRGTTTPAPGTHYFTTGQTLSLTAQPAAGYMLADWMYTVVDPTGDTVVDAEYADTNVTDFFDIFEDFPAVGPMLDGYIINVTPIFQGVIPTTHTVTVTSMNPQMGTVNPEGDSVVNDGSSFTATATANDGYHFVNWVDAGSNVITDNPYTFVVNSNVTLRAVFAADSVAPTTYTVTVNVNDSTMGHVTGVPTAPVTANTVISLTAVPEAGYHFVSWSNGANTATITVTVTSDTVLTATFAANPADTYTLTVAYDATMGSVEGIPEAPVAAGTVVTLTAIPAEGYHFVEWSTGETTATISVTVNSNMTLTATFEANAVETYEVRVLWDATMGNVTGVPEGPVAAGTSVTLMANPLEGYKFVAWMIGEDTVGHNAVYTIDSVSDNVTLVALFAVKTGIEDVEMSNVKIYSAESVIYVMGAEGQNVYLYDLNGRVINAAPKAGERVEFRMNNTGVYLVKVGTAAAKRVVVTR